MPATSPRPSLYRERGDSRLHGERAAVHHVAGRRRIPRLAFYVLCLAASYSLAVFMVRPHVPRSRFLSVLAPASARRLQRAALDQPAPGQEGEDGELLNIYR